MFGLVVIHVIDFLSHQPRKNNYLQRFLTTVGYFYVLSIQKATKGKTCLGSSSLFTDKKKEKNYQNKVFETITDVLLFWPLTAVKKMFSFNFIVFICFSHVVFADVQT